MASAPTHIGAFAFSSSILMFSVTVATVVDFPLQPATYRSLGEVEGSLDAIVGCPPPGALDLALPLAAAHAQVVLFRVPADYVLEAPWPRARWLDSMQRAGRLVFLQEPPEPRPGLSPWLWAVVYSSAAAARWLATWPDFGNARRLHKAGAAAAPAAIAAT